MSNTPSEVENFVCTCGRGFSHCRKCGSRNVYVKKFRSLETGVVTYGCRRCAAETNVNGSCEAPSRVFDTGYKAFQKPELAPPWGNLAVGSPEYLNLFGEEASRRRDKKHIDMNEAYAQLIKEGWPLAEENMDDELKAFLRSKGLLQCPAEGNAQDQSAVGQGGDLGAKEAATDSEASLDEIIKAMNEEQK